MDSHGIHHVVPPAPLECAEGEVAFGVLELSRRGEVMRWEWVGRLPMGMAAEHWPTELAYPV